ncbi:MAG: GNAT family N-acetyltransferase [Candidatus Dormibacteria bacterium]
MPGAIGEDIAFRVLERTGGQLVPMAITAPSNVPANVRLLRQTSHVWLRQARSVASSDPEAARHAYFASDVAFLAASDLGEPNVHVLVAQDEPGVAAEAVGGTIHGITIYRWGQDDVWHLDYQTTRPHDQPFWPSTDKVKGVGTLLLQAAAKEMAKNNCTTVELETLDESAERFWRARGFTGTEEPLQLTCSQLQGLAANLRIRPHDDPAPGEWVAAGQKKKLADVSMAGGY